MNFQEAVAEYNTAREALSVARDEIKELTAKREEEERRLTRATAALTAALANEKRCKRRLVEASGKIPGLLHADVSGIVGKLDPDPPLDLAAKLAEI